MNNCTRREFIKTSTAFALAVRQRRYDRGVGAEPTVKRKFTMDLACGMIGVKASPREAIQWAAEYGFESVAPAVDALAKLSDAEMEEIRNDLKSRGLKWGAAGRGIDFRSDESAFAEGLKEIVAWAKAAARAGVVPPPHGFRRGTIRSPTWPISAGTPSGFARSARCSTITGCGLDSSTSDRRHHGAGAATRSSTRWPR